MSGTGDEAATATAGRPRDERATAAILRAALALADEVGFDKLSIQGIAARAETRAPGRERGAVGGRRGCASKRGHHIVVSVRELIPSLVRLKTRPGGSPTHNGHGCGRGFPVPRKLSHRSPPVTQVTTMKGP